MHDVPGHAEKLPQRLNVRAGSPTLGVNFCQVACMSDLIRPVFDFSGKTALITGATSGIGAAIAEAFARSGADVVFAGRSANRAESLLERIRPLGVQAHFIAGDITDPAYCERLSIETVSLIGVPDFLVNSAGVIYHATTEETSDAQWHHTFNVNVHGTFYLCRAVIPAMRSSGGGVIINIASDAALGGSPHLVAYCASKGAVLQMTRAMAVDHARDNIRVLAICPGDVDTAMLRGEFDARGMGVDQGLAESAEAVPLNRVCSPEEIADLVLFSCSDSARFITGSPLVIDGGSLA
jgi:meso-butanediol dehydrogenase/(S,S)-butanediol dehydrogenase/diacetyl reductase